eukprot:SM000821S22583  [mRNA]  locus=s821:1613:2157:- [translate_table: standard]
MDLTFGDIPWPVPPGSEPEMGALLLAGVPPAEHRKRLRTEVLRWHPDKFVQRWGQRLSDKEQERIVARVNEISQAVHGLYAALHLPPAA